MINIVQGAVINCIIASTMSDKKEIIKDKLRQALPHFRHAIKTASEEVGDSGTVMFGILTKKHDGSGRIIADFRANEFFDDIAELLDLPIENSEEEDLDAQAVEMLYKAGLRR